MTKKLLERIEKENKNVFLNIESLKSRYGRNTEKHEVVLAEIRGFLIGLKLLGFITEREKQILHCYITL